MRPDDGLRRGTFKSARGFDRLSLPADVAYSPATTRRPVITPLAQRAAGALSAAQPARSSLRTRLTRRLESLGLRRRRADKAPVRPLHIARRAAGAAR